MFDRFAVAHAGWGAAMAFAGATAGEALAASVAWELAEPTLKDLAPRVFPSETLDTGANKLGDTIAWMAGYAAAALIKDRAKKRKRSR